MQVAQQRDALRHQKFHFRKCLSTSKNILPVRFRESLLSEQTPDTPSLSSARSNPFETNACEHRLMTINEIINGSVMTYFLLIEFELVYCFQNEFVGLLNIVQDYLTNIEVDADTRCTINQYLNLISRRAAGSLLTNATWMRQFVRNHPAYKHDSAVSDEIAYDLLWKMKRITNDEDHCPEVLPRVLSKTTLDVSAAIEKDNSELEVKRSLMQHQQR